MEDRRQVHISIALNPDLRIKCIKIFQYIFPSLSPNSESGEIQIVLHPTKQYNSQSISYCPQVQSAGLAGGFPDKQRLQGLYYNTYK